MLSTPRLSEPRGSRSFTPTLACRVFLIFDVSVWGFFLFIFFINRVLRGMESQRCNTVTASQNSIISHRLTIGF